MKLHIRPHHFFLLLAFFLLSGQQFVHAVEPEYNLVRINITEAVDQQNLADINLPIFGDFLSPENTTYILASVTESQLDTLNSIGFDPQVLDKDIKDTEFIEVYPIEAGNISPIYELDDILAFTIQSVIIHNSPEIVDELLRDGYSIRRLHLHPVIISKTNRVPDIPTITTPDPLIQTLISRVSSNAAYNQVGFLSGEANVTINGTPYRIYTRNSYASNAIQKATRYAYELFENMGFQPYYHYYQQHGMFVLFRSFLLDRIQ